MLADLDNLRKRARQESLDARATGRTDILREMLLLQDAVARGLQSAAQAGTIESLRDGLRLIERGIADLLARQGIERIATDGQTFDPHQHEAVGTAPVTAVSPEHTIVSEVRAGYRLRDQVLRPAQVIVATAESG